MNQNPEVDLKASRVVVTGGAGFIGSSLVGLLVANGASVVVIDNLVNGKRENLHLTSRRDVSLEVADIRDTSRMRQLLEGVDIVYHLACLGVRHSLIEPIENHAVNATATLQLLQIARDMNVGLFVCVSSSEVYGTATTVPMSEDHPTLPSTVYGASKLAGESYTRAFHDTYGYPTVVVRPFNAYGPRCHHEGDSGEVIPKFMLRSMARRPMIIFGDGTQTRDFTFVEDTARGILLAGASQSGVGETINIGNGSEITINELARVVATTAGLDEVCVRHDQERPGDVLRLYSDSSKARKLLGYSPRVLFEDGLGKLRDWYLSQDVPIEQLLESERVHNWKTEGD